MNEKMIECITEIIDKELQEHPRAIIYVPREVYKQLKFMYPNAHLRIA